MQISKKRPLYETTADLQGEKNVCEKFCKHFGLTPHKLPMSYELDFMLTKKQPDEIDKAVSFLEYKRRNFAFDEFPTVMLSLKKVMRGHELSKAAGIPSVFLVKFNNALGSCCFSNFINKPEFIEFGGRTKNTRDSGDIEPVVMIPTKMFQLWELEILG